MIDLQQLATPVNFDPFADGDIVLTAPATAAQKEIWASVKMGEDANCAYNESISLSLQGELNVDNLTTALNLLVERHESLRTTLSPDGEMLCINSSSQLEIQSIDLANLTPSAQAEKIAALKHQSVVTPFDLQHDALFRVALLKLTDREHQLLLSAHHIICDGWSWGVIITDLGKLYSGLKSGDGADLDPVDVFSDYARELATQVGSQTEQEITAYWLQQFSGSIPVLDLPTDYPRPKLRTFESDRLDYELSAAVVAELKQLGKASGCSFMTVLIASFEILLHRITGQDDLVVGVPSAGQLTAEQYNLVGHCVNLLPLRTQIDGNQSFQDYLAARSSAILDAYDRQPFTFGSLLSKLVLPRDASRIPLVSVIFNIDRGLESDQLDYADLDVTYVTNPRRSENFELYINATEFKDKTILEWQYNTNLFAPATIDRRMAEFETLLAGIVANPQQQLDRLPILPQHQRQTIENWSRDPVAYPHELCIHQLVEAQVAKTPQAIAIEWETESMTYDRLNHHANQLAHYLQTLGVGANSLVGIYIDRSIDLLVGVLGILKAGGAYIPLDPTYPQERIAFMLADAKASVVLTQQASLANLPEFDAHKVCIDTDWEQIALHSSDNPNTAITPANLAYVIYTSGSTGTPKGVSLNHRPLVNLIAWQIAASPLSPTAKTLQFTPISFDVSFQEIFATWCAGGTLVPIGDDTRKDASELLQLLKDRAIERLFLPFVALQQLAEVAHSRNITCPALRQVITAGEQLQISSSIANWFAQQPQCSLHNHYGPSETHVVTAYTLTGAPHTWMSLPPIGRAIDNTQVYLLDAHYQPVPIGVTGELWVGVADEVRGYLDRPELTAAKFIPNPLEPKTTARLYRTGDLARYLPDGHIEYLGRSDGQVKVRGFRIELGEIEATIGRFPATSEAVAIVREDVPGDRRLVAYVTLKDRQDGTIAELKTFLKQKLPEHSIPTVFVTLDALPLTPSGKVDRRALPIPDASRRDLDASYVAPTTPMETQIVQVWGEILKLDKIGIHDNFFELGGYSLLGTQAIARLRQLFGVDLALRVLFELPTVAELANRVATLQWATQSLANTPAATGDFEEGEL